MVEQQGSGLERQATKELKSKEAAGMSAVAADEETNADDMETQATEDTSERPGLAAPAEAGTRSPVPSSKVPLSQSPPLAPIEAEGSLAGRSHEQDEVRARAYAGPDIVLETCATSEPPPRPAPVALMHGLHAAAVADAAAAEPTGSVKAHAMMHRPCSSMRMGPSAGITLQFPQPIVAVTATADGRSGPSQW